MKPLVIGLTGGIGCGKSSAAEFFIERGAPVIDTDEIAHQLTRPGGPAMAPIRHTFGPDYLKPDGALDRAKMRGLVFSDAVAKVKLERILHPLIRDEVARRVAACTGPYMLIAVPLLLETGGYRELIERVLVVDCDEEMQIARTMQRSRLSRDEVQAIMGTQVSRESRLRQADDVLSNNGDWRTLAQQVEALHAKYLALAGAGEPARISTKPQ